MTKPTVTISVYSPADRGYPIAERRGGPVPALHSTVLYTRADGTLARCRVADVCWSYYPDGGTEISVFTDHFLADRRPATDGARASTVTSGGAA